MKATLTPRPADSSRTEHVRPRVERVLLLLETLLAVGAFAGALGLLTGGIDLGIASDRLPFGSTVFAGWALALVNGVLPALVIVGALRRRRWSEWGHLMVGVALVTWIVVQVSILGPPVHWVQALYFGWGVAILALAIDLRHVRR